METTFLLEKLWQQYIAITPSAKKIHELLQQKGEVIENDHIAIRTFNDPRVSISVLEIPFLEAGYEAKNTYFFESKKLFAKHYEHTTNVKAPRIFISELELDKCSKNLQETIKDTLDQCPKDAFTDKNLIFSGTIWNNNSYTRYAELLAESEYAAWMYVYGFRANHFTINVNALSHFESLESLNEYLKENNWKLNPSGGEIKGSPAELLEQSSTLADLCEIHFNEGSKAIPSCYYEFARRYALPNGELYQGFIAASADKIFESTDVKLQEKS